MKTVNVYSSAPVSTKLACAFQGLKSLGMQVVLRPLSALPAPPHPRRRQASLRDELTEIEAELSAIGEVLDKHVLGCRQLSAGDENGLRFQYDALQSRRRSIQAALRAQEGGQRNG